MRKKYFTVIAAIMLVLGIASCSGGSDDKASDGRGVVVSGQQELINPQQIDKFAAIGPSAKQLKVNNIGIVANDPKEIGKAEGRKNIGININNDAGESVTLRYSVDGIPVMLPNVTSGEQAIIISVPETATQVSVSAEFTDTLAIIDVLNGSVLTQPL